MSPKPSQLKVCYVTRGDPDHKDWSGTPYWTRRHLQAHGYALDAVRGEPAWARVVLAPMKGVARLLGRNYLLRHADLYHWILRRSLKRALSGKAYDVVFLQDAVLAAAVDHPNAVFWCDAQLEVLYEAYLPGYWARTLNTAAALRREREAVTNVRWVLCASPWARDALADRYPQHAGKMVIAPFPENMPVAADEAVAQAIEARPFDELRLLLIGVDWFRKGGDRAMALLNILRARGAPARLTIVGSEPFAGEVPDGVRQLGFLDKSTPEGLARLHDELLRSHFLLLPSRAEAMGIALVEAHAHGVPTITSDVGGIVAVIEPGQNGLAFDFEDIEAVADEILRLWRDPEIYRRLAQSTRARFLEKFSAEARMQQIDMLLRGGAQAKTQFRTAPKASQRSSRART